MFPGDIKFNIPVMPSYEEFGRIFMLLSPFAFIIGLFTIALLSNLWKKIRPEVELHWKHNLIGLGICLILLLLAHVFGARSSIFEIYAWICKKFILWTYFFASYLCLILLTWRTWFFFSKKYAFGLSWLPVLILMLWPCPVIALGYADSFNFNWLRKIMNIHFSFLLLPGYLWIAPMIMFGVILLEVLLSIYYFKKRKSIGNHTN